MADPIRIMQRLGLIPTVVAAAALFAMMAMTFADVVLRSAFNAPIEAATELTRILMAIVVFSVLPVVSGRGSHISVDLLDRFVGSALGRVRDVIINLACGAMLFWPGWRCVVLAERARDYGDVTEYLGIPQFYVGWFVAVSVFVTAIALIVRGLLLALAPHLIVKPDEPAHD